MNMLSWWQQYAPIVWLLLAIAFAVSEGLTGPARIDLVRGGRGGYRGGSGAARRVVGGPALDVRDRLGRPADRHPADRQKPAPCQKGEHQRRPVHRPGGGRHRPDRQRPLRGTRAGRRGSTGRARSSDGADIPAGEKIRVLADRRRQADRRALQQTKPNHNRQDTQHVGRSSLGDLWY